jgi:hypothetical protein
MQMIEKKSSSANICGTLNNEKSIYFVFPNYTRYNVSASSLIIITFHFIFHLDQRFY